MLEVGGGPNQSSGASTAKNGFSFNRQVLLHFLIEVWATSLCPSTNKENCADSGFVSAMHQQDSFWSYGYNHNELFVHVCTRSHIVPRPFGKTFTETKGTESYQMLPITLLDNCNPKALNSEMSMKISSGKGGNWVPLYPDENAHLSSQIKHLSYSQLWKGFRCLWKPFTSLLNQLTAQCHSAQRFVSHTGSTVGQRRGFSSYK